MGMNLIMALVYACYLFLTLKNVPRVNMIDLEKAGDLPTALSYICCCGCLRSSTRDRRYESVLNMVNLESGDQDEYYHRRSFPNHKWIQHVWVYEYNIYVLTMAF